MPFKKLIFITTHEIYSTHPQSSPDLHCFKAAVLDYIDLIQRIRGSFVSYSYMRVMTATPPLSSENGLFSLLFFGRLFTGTLVFSTLSSVLYAW
jgi:hypothetical protein